jgi:hypothetical protein
MPPKSKTPKGELTTAEIRKLIRAHNILTSIKIPTGATREQIIKIVDQKGYTVNHEKKSLDPKGGIRKGQPRVKLEKKLLNQNLRLNYKNKKRQKQRRRKPRRKRKKRELYVRKQLKRRKQELNLLLRKRKRKRNQHRKRNPNQRKKMK